MTDAGCPRNKDRRRAGKGPQRSVQRQAKGAKVEKDGKAMKETKGARGPATKEAKEVEKGKTKAKLKEVQCCSI